MGSGRKILFSRVQALFTEIFGLGRAAALSAVLLISLFTIFAVFWFFHAAPPRTIIITSGPEGSIFRRNAEKYGKILARNGVKLESLPSQGSQAHINRLAEPACKVDIGVARGRVAGALDIHELTALGSVSY